MFTGKELMYYLGQYTLVSYDQQEQQYGILWWRSFGRTPRSSELLCERSKVKTMSVCLSFGVLIPNHLIPIGY